MQRRIAYRLPPLNLLMLCLEISLILGCIYGFTLHLQNWSPLAELRGTDLTLNNDSGSVSSLIFNRTGHIPLWNPLVANGEPTFESMYSYMLNPFLFLPILWQGGIQGVKTGVLIHIVIMGLGGWTLGRVLRFGPAGRVLLGILLAGNGSMAAGVGNGCYEISNSLAYVPWIMAGLIGILYMGRRWAIGLLVVATTLMIFCGTFWYVLPTAITAALLVLFALFYRRANGSGFEFDLRPVPALVLAAIFVVGLTAIRTLPLVNSYLVYHPLAGIGANHDWGQIVRSLVTTEVVSDTEARYGFNYAVPLAFGAALLGLRLLFFRYRHPNSEGRWRIYLPVCIAIGIFMLWAQEGTPLMRWLYTFTPLSQWRWPPRVMAAASPWIAVFAAFWFDDLVQMLWPLTDDRRLHSAYPGLSQWHVSLRSRRIPAGRLVLPWMPLAAMLSLAIFLIVGLGSALDVLANWIRVSGIEDVRSDAREVQIGVRFLRDQYPADMLSLRFEAMLTAYEVFTQFGRDVTANPEVHTHGLPATIGPNDSMDMAPEYALTIHDGFQQVLKDQGYSALADSPQMNNSPIVWRNPSAPPYAFWVRRRLLENLGGPLTRDAVHPVSYWYGVDRIVAMVDAYDRKSVLVIQETAYPGWTVSINGQPAAVESVGGRLGVVLPDTLDNPDNLPTEILFTYRPTMFYWGAAISFLVFLIFSAFLLRLDRRIPEAVLTTWSRFRKRAIYVLTSPDILSGMFLFTGPAASAAFLHGVVPADRRQPYD